MNTPPDRRIDSVRLQNLAQSYGQSAALMAAVELDLFSAVSAGADTVADIARALDIHPVNAERLVTMLTAAGLLQIQDGRYRNADDVEKFLVKDTRHYAGPWMLFTKPGWGEWGRLVEHLRRKQLSVLGPLTELTVEAARAYHEATFSIGLGAGRRFARQVDLSGRRRLLDLGGGSGAYCISAVQAYPELRAVVLDLAPVVEVARQFIAENAAAERVEAIAGDFTTDPIPKGADVIVMASNLPMYGPEVIASVIARSFDALEPGGEMHLIGETLDDDRSGPVGPAFWGLHQAIAGTFGVAHSEADCLDYFRRAGFVEVAASDFVKGSLTRIRGLKAA